ncbi:MAG: B12-binding domain-containing radical SAM protein [candidate division NC10 bacterium]|nr:B12-binding domain-containing radical SAM protein [candidate division NC10 bacterium]
MKILLLQPSTLNPDGSVLKSKRRWLLGLTLPYLAGLTPKDIQVRLLDDRLEEVDYKEDCDLVAITYMSHNSLRAYQIADGFQERGKTVIMGGFHASFLPLEAIQHCNAVVIGEAEDNWKAALQDFKGGRLQPFYRAEKFHDLKGLPTPRYELLNLKRYRLTMLPVQTTRGCPMGCEFCEVTNLYGRTYRFRPIEEVVAEIREGLDKVKEAPGVYFVDDNIAVSRSHAWSLFEALLPLKIQWTCLCNIDLADDKELLDLAIASGCRHVNIGIESIDQESLDTVKKRFNKVNKYKGQLEVLHKRGLFFSLNIIFGLDNDNKQTFTDTLRFLIENKVPLAFIFILTPRPGTKIREKMEVEGRILHSDWSRYSSSECVFKPKSLTPEELDAGMWETYERFYSLRSIMKRLLPPRQYFSEAFFSNLFFRFGVRKRIHPVNFY